MDRFLSIYEIKKTHLQILAAACLLLASKLREPSCRALPAHLLVFYTDNSITKKDLIVSTQIILVFFSSFEFSLLFLPLPQKQNSLKIIYHLLNVYIE